MLTITAEYLWHKDSLKQQAEAYGRPVTVTPPLPGDCDVLCYLRDDQTGASVCVSCMVMTDVWPGAFRKLMKEISS